MSISSTGLSRHELRGAKPLAVTVAMARELSGLGNTTIWALIKSGKLESTSVGRRRLIIYGSLEKLLFPEPPDPLPQPQRGRPPKRPLAHKCERNAQDDQGAPRRGVIISAEVGT